MPKKITEAGIKEYLQTLSKTPGRIAAATSGHDETRLRTPPTPGEWSAVQILAHLKSSADVWAYSIYAMLTLDNPQLADIHPRAWAKIQKYEKVTFAETLLAFEVERRNLLRILHGLSFEDWGRSSTFIGKVNTFTIFGQTMRMAMHDLDHCQQIEAMFASL